MLRSNLAIERADVCLLMIDADDGATEQDTKIAGLIHEAGKACIILVNKWDLLEKETNTMEKERKKIYDILSFMKYAPVLFISVKEGTRIQNIFELINEVYSERQKRISTGLVNEVLGDAVIRLQPPSDKGKRLKLYYMTQTGVAPPTFVIFCNDTELFHFSYKRYIENRIREAFGFKGSPIRIIIKQKGDKV